MTRTTSKVARLLILFSLVILGADAESPSPATSPTTTAVSVESKSQLQARLAEAEAALNERGPAIQKRLGSVTKALQALDERRDAMPASEFTERREKLVAEQSALRKTLTFLEAAKTSWQAALDAQESASGFAQEREQLQTGTKGKQTEYVDADVKALQTQLHQVQSARSSLDDAQEVRAKRLAALERELEKADGNTRSLLETERAALQGESEAVRLKRAALDLEEEALRAKLQLTGRAVGRLASTPPTTTTTAPTPREQEAEARIKKEVAERIQAEARDRLERIQAELRRIQEQLKQATAGSPEGKQLETDREYWHRVEAYEKRRLEQAELTQIAANEKQGIAQLLERREATRKQLEQLRETRRWMSEAERKSQQQKFLDEAEAAAERAAELRDRAKAEEAKISPLRKLLVSIDAMQHALYERMRKAQTDEASRRLSDHYRRMERHLDIERQQIDLMITTMENITFAITRRATLERELAELYQECATVLVPPEKTFWQRNEKTINAVRIAIFVFLMTYAVKVFVWLFRHAVAAVSRWIPSAGGRGSVKRVGTLVSFAGSIVKLFVWVFGLITILNEFGIDYAKSTGAIGLIGLIMAGMFQQLVVDFVKGLDIIAGGHYNVGDFVEVDGKYGHVIDFNVKYTALRTLSGQEVHIPNSRCVPSRRFPDGFVNNYVDVTLASRTDEDRARQVIAPHCADLNHRIEPMRDTPGLVVCFDSPGDRVVLRYRVRVLPGCDWVVTERFIPTIKQALADAGIELAGEPTFFFINRLDTFRKLFSRQLSEEEIARQLSEEERIRQLRNAERGPSADDSAARQPGEPPVEVERGKDQGDST